MMNGSTGGAEVIVVGGGISGLTAAYMLRSLGHSVTLMEEKTRVGGCIETLVEDGFLVELGPNSALETTPLIGELLRELGIADRLVYADEKAQKRYIVRNGRLRRVPMSPPAFLTSPLFSLNAKLRLLKEPFVKPAEGDESLADFVERRFGREFLDYAINPFVAGVYAGDPSKLSVRAAFPRLYELEKRYGSILAGAFKSRKERKERKKKGEVSKQSARLFSFRDGLSTLTGTLASKLETGLLTGSRVVECAPAGSPGGGRRYRVVFEANGRLRAMEADAVILAVPAHAASTLVRPLDGELAGALSELEYPPVAMVFTGYRTEDVKRELDGFGYLVPQVEKRRILGTIWSSTIFPGRAPHGHAAFTTFVGGSRQPELALLGEEELARIVEEELRFFHRIEGEPVYRKVRIWKRAIPQYTLGHEELMEKLEKFESRHRGIHFCANFRGGISIADCIESAGRVARHLSQALLEKG